jgi:A/G-specific adenine glycosylase
MGISNLLLSWFKKEGRELPWRESQKPYEIWVSEIILQQTRINQGTAYYHAFLERFPDVFSLASADITDVLKVWQGLGYYSRARNMHETARKLVSEYKGNFPESFEEIVKLKGIGEYTAGAIASIIFNERAPAIDGNVKRVISRIFGITEDIGKATTIKKIRTHILKEIPSQEPGNFNQALMDLGSMICKPTNPLCDRCPLNEICIANKLDQVNEIPVKYRKINTRIRHFLYLIIQSEDKLLINKRSGKDIWEQLYDFPLLELKAAPVESDIYHKVQQHFLKSGETFRLIRISPVMSHVLSHQKILARFIHIESDTIPPSLEKKFILINKSEIHQYPLPRLIEKYLSES